MFPELLTTAFPYAVLPDLCHGVAGFAGLGLHEKTARIQFNDVFWANHFAPSFTVLNLCCHTFLPTNLMQDRVY